MLKTINFRFHPGLLRFYLAVCLLTVCVPGLVAQQGSTAKPAQPPVPATAGSKSGSAQSSGPAEVRSKTSQAVIDSSLPDDPALNKMLEPYTGKVRALDVVIDKLEGELKKDGLGGGTLGNFVTDGVGTLGNHEFDNGVAALAVAMKFASFDFVSANYDVRGTVLEKRVKRYVVRELAGVRIGLFGLGVSPTGLITPANFQGITYQDPVAASRSVVKVLEETERCHLIVCMSHLGYYKVPKDDDIGDSQVAAQVDGIDFIASGHTHTFMKQPVVQKQPSGKETVIFQVGKSGINLGRVDFTIRAGQVTAWAGHLLDLRDESLG
jgi:hypothetical protein